MYKQAQLLLLMCKDTMQLPGYTKLSLQLSSALKAMPIQSKIGVPARTAAFLCRLLQKMAARESTACRVTEALTRISSRIQYQKDLSSGSPFAAIALASTSKRASLQALLAGELLS
jgi:hypothetical protein